MLFARAQIKGKASDKEAICNQLQFDESLHIR